MSTTSTPCSLQASGERLDEHGARGRMSRATTTRSAPAAVTKVAKPTPESVCDVGVDLVVHGAADVVGLDDLIQD